VLYGTRIVSIRRVNLTDIVVLGYFVRFKRVGEGFDTFENYINSYLVKYDCVLVAT
jgi:hypothetical protein